MTNHRITTKPNAASMLKQQLASTRAKSPQTIDDSFAQPIGRRLEERQIARVPGLPAEESEPEWFDRVIEHDRRTKQLQEQQAAQQQLEEDAHNARQTTTSILMGEIAKAATNSDSPVIPLNGAQVLRAALAGGSGTVNGEDR